MPHSWSELTGFVLTSELSSASVSLIQNQDLLKDRNGNGHMEPEWELCEMSAPGRGVHGVELGLHP